MTRYIYLRHFESASLSPGDVICLESAGYWRVECLMGDVAELRRLSWAARAWRAVADWIGGRQ